MKASDVVPLAATAPSPSSVASCGFPATPTRGTLHLLLRGTNFQIKVWEALIRVDPGTPISYDDLARRAAGSALAANRIAYPIPCHRVIRQSGEIGSYRWGSSRKLALLGWEAGIGERTGAAAGDEA